MPIEKVRITWTPDDGLDAQEGWLCPENIKLCLEGYTSRTKFTVEYLWKEKVYRRLKGTYIAFKWRLKTFVTYGLPIDKDLILHKIRGVFHGKKETK